MLDFGNKFIKM